MEVKPNLNLGYEKRFRKNLVFKIKKAEIYLGEVVSGVIWGFTCIKPRGIDKTLLSDVLELCSRLPEPKSKSKNKNKRKVR
jgi:hypothetical protein